ncbi:hypothetical protein GCM10027610_102530 [Dactylosporangium cerinum]
MIALRPRLLLLDEPTANLDPDGAQLVRAALGKALHDVDATMVLVEHRLADALTLVDRVVTLGPEQPPLVVPDRRARTGPGATLLTAGRLALRDTGNVVDEQIRAGEVLAVEGPNGAGKSTLALLLGGLTRPAKPGTVTAAGERRPPHRWRAAKLAARIGSVFQNPEHQFVTATVRDELLLGGSGPGVVDELLSRLRLDRLALANPYTLSGGEQRRLSVATALAAAPELLILDEPTFGQDPQTWRELVDLLADLRDEGRGLVIVTHDRQLVEALGDRRLRLERR